MLIITVNSREPLINYSLYVILFQHVISHLFFEQSIFIGIYCYGFIYTTFHERTIAQLLVESSMEITKVTRVKSTYQLDIFVTKIAGNYSANNFRIVSVK